MKMKTEEKKTCRDCKYRDIEREKGDKNSKYKCIKTGETVRRERKACELHKVKTEWVMTVSI
jgi:hypothetical protein